jgi:hypothetical protein
MPQPKDAVVLPRFRQILAWTLPHLVIIFPSSNSRAAIAYGQMQDVRDISQVTAQDV